MLFLNISTRSLLAISGRAIGDGVAALPIDRVADDGAVWNPPVQSTGTLTAALIFSASGRLMPSIFDHRRGASSQRRLRRASEQLAAEQHVVAEGVRAARNQRVVGLAQLLEREVAGRILRMREHVAGGDVNRVDAVLDEPLAHLDRLVDGVALRVVVNRARRRIRSR